MKISFIVTIFNEERTIERFFESLIKQTKKPNEIIVVDGGSTDDTIDIIKKYESRIFRKKIKLSYYIKKGNRSVGRNEAIRRASGDIIACSDAGNTLDKKWLENITKPFIDKRIDVVAGYYRGKAKNNFQKALIPYVLVMPNRVNPKEFLPATRSIAFTKKIWEKVKGFDEKYSHNEDYVFAKKLKRAGAKIFFAKDAIVYWLPRKNIKEAFTMFFRFAYGDSEAGILRTKVFFIFLRYFLYSYLLILEFITKSLVLGVVLFSFFALYIFWAVIKNYNYVKNPAALFYLPILQLVSDVAVISGTTISIFKLSTSAFLDLFAKNKGLLIILPIYILTASIFLSMGIPNTDHPFAYFMDEWHQLQSVRNVFIQGTPNIEGSANGSMFHFFLSGIYLIPFQLLGAVDINSIQSSISNLDMQSRLFMILRSSTILYGIGSIITLYYISKKYFKLNPLFITTLFALSPVWIIMSSYFKYDVALAFWILLTFLFFIKFLHTSSGLNYYLSGFFAGISLAVKISAIPLLPVFILIFLLFKKKWYTKIKILFIGLLVYFATFFSLGIPDVLIGIGNLNEYLVSNLQRTPSEVSFNYSLGMNYLQYLLFKIYPITFGNIFFYLFLISMVGVVVVVFRKIFESRKKLDLQIIRENKLSVLLGLLTIFFFASMYPLKLQAIGNRVVILMPFMLIFTFSFFKYIIRLKKNNKKFVWAILGTLLVLFHISQTVVWLGVKISSDPRITASNWILENFVVDTEIGIESIPIYQMLPDIVVKEYYSTIYKAGKNGNFNYVLIDSGTDELPDRVIVSNDDIAKNFILKSEKKLLIRRLERENYELIAKFKPNFDYYNLFSDEEAFYLSGLVIMPNSISIYSR